jgi:hypothetical protein
MPTVPPRLAPFLAQWDYVTEFLLERLEGITDEEYRWEAAPRSWTVRLAPDGTAVPDVEAWPPTSEAAPPRTIAWSIGHLGVSVFERADWLTGTHSVRSGDIPLPTTAEAGLAAMRRGLDAWRHGLVGMTDEDLDTVGRSAYPGGLDPTLPLIEIVWWVNKELVWHSAEIWLMRDLYAATSGSAASSARSGTRAPRRR